MLCLHVWFIQKGVYARRVTDHSSEVQGDNQNAIQAVIL